mmetsp:Transcript_1727/g.2448  ORF Transcript_1727/g.2448 Transcript_1727/m.2448 type:complete len:229 (+) Transcript_1727:115-801(+)
MPGELKSYKRSNVSKTDKKERMDLLMPVNSLSSDKQLYQDDVLSTFMECTFGEPLPFYETPYSSNPFAVESEEDMKPILKKRKSEDWDAKPLQKRSHTSFDFNTLGREFSMDSELTMCSDKFVDLLLTERRPAAIDFALLEKSKKKRTRWTEAEVKSLWDGIEKYGNNWRAINKNCLEERTYYQVKDKGRRLLTSEGWISGHKDANVSSADAKRIGKLMNKKLYGKKK